MTIHEQIIELEQALRGLTEEEAYQVVYEFVREFQIRQCLESIDQSLKRIANERTKK